MNLPNRLTKISCATLLASLVTLSEAFGAPKIPDKPVIDTVNQPGGPIVGGAASYAGPSTGESARQGIIEGDYPQLQPQFQKILDSIRAQSPYPELPVHLHIATNPRPNAFTLPGGNIYLQSGLVDALTTTDKDAPGQAPHLNTDSIAFFLAHEYTHALFNDPASQTRENNANNQLASTITLLANLSGATRSASIATVTSCTSATGTNPLHVLAGEVMTGDLIRAELYRYSYGPFSRETETRADFLATDLLIKLKVDPIAGSKPMQDIFETYDKGVRALLKSQLDFVKSSMQNSAQQLGSCAPTILQQAAVGGNLKGQLDGFIKTQIVGWITRFVGQRLNPDEVHVYYSADTRVKAIQKYVDKFYQGQVFGQQTTAFGGGAKPAEALVADQGINSRIQDIITAEAKGDFQAAITGVDRLENAKGFKPGMSFYLAAGIAARGIGDFKRSIRYFETGSKHNEATVEIFRDLASVYMQNNQFDLAVGALDRGEAKIGDRKLFIADRISLYYAHGDAAKVSALVTECEAMGDKNLTAQCHAAAGMSEANDGVIDKIRNLPGIPGLPGLP